MTSSFARPIDPIAKYQRINGDTLKVLSATVGTSGANTQIVAAVTGKVIRVMGMYLQSSTATASSVFFKSGSGGTVLWNVGTIPITTNGLFTFFPIVDSGYFEAAVSTGLYADIDTAACYITVFYITYTP